MIRLVNLNKSFGGNHVLKDVNLEVNEGEKLVIIGPSGSGKSTTVRCMNFLEEPTSGEVYIDGTKLTKKNHTKVVRNTSSMVFQQFNLYPHKTVLENLMLAPVKLHGKSRAEAKELAMKYLTMVGLAEKADAYPATLSGGQQQRVAIARALVNNPVMILADEATGNLDTRTSFEILTLFQRLHAEGSTIVFVTHNPEIAQFSSRNIVLRDGHITDDVRNGNIRSAQAVLDTIPVDNGM